MKHRPRASIATKVDCYGQGGRIRVEQTKSSLDLEKQRQENEVKRAAQGKEDVLKVIEIETCCRSTIQSIYCIAGKRFNTLFLLR